LPSSQNNKNFDITQGDTFNLKITCKVPDPNSTDLNNPNYIPLDITGFTFLMEVKDKPGGNILAASASLGDGITIIDATNGIINVNLSPAKTNKFSNPKAAYQIQRTDTYGNKVTILQGWFIVGVGVING
jgi:hypothetical protein